MKGETNLQVLVRSMKPELNPGEYVFCTVAKGKQVDHSMLVGLVREKEGVTLILPRARADESGLAYTFVASWISLEVHSSLEAVGLTAVFSSALARANISCNVIAGYYHDHLFVPVKDTQKALEVLAQLAHDY